MTSAFPAVSSSREAHFRECETFLKIGGVSIELYSNGGVKFAPGESLRKFEVDSVLSAIDIRILRNPAIRSTSGKLIFDSGSVWRLFQDEIGLRFDFFSPMLGSDPYRRLRIDDQYSRASLELSGRCAPYGEFVPDALEYPLDELLIMHRLTQERAIELHGTGIMRGNGVANLFVGHSGAGKSTTTRLWTSREEVEVLSDDRIIVRYDDGRDGPAGPTQTRMYGTPWHGEAMFASPNSAPLTRIFVLEHGRGNVITRLSPSEAIGELFARAFVPFHRHEYIENALSFLEELVSAVPCYRYTFEPDERAVEKIQQFHD